MHKPHGGGQFLSRNLRRAILVICALAGIYFTLKIVSNISSSDGDDGTYSERWVTQCLAKLGGSHAGTTLSFPFSSIFCPSTCSNHLVLPIILTHYCFNYPIQPDEPAQMNKVAGSCPKEPPKKLLDEYTMGGRLGTSFELHFSILHSIT